ncbi:hypothetical protein NEISICOT_00943 [Neisseria sicca ATCC 29256]|uniref:Uncharacterized protein n=1 Tax=Neisseria sicca ATCC 29256 TaxID=547045 RepID=C6M352_NEISI|nr:hypothetical protein NEISICOT_00943 [Neisseria sicca ATCC 29256]
MTKPIFHYILSNRENNKLHELSRFRRPYVAYVIQCHVVYFQNLTQIRICLIS